MRCEGCGEEVLSVFYNPKDGKYLCNVCRNTNIIKHIPVVYMEKGEAGDLE